MGSDKYKNLADIIGNLPKNEPIIPNTYDMFNPNRKEYHSPKILDEGKEEFERPDFSEWRCVVCNNTIEDGYFWYYLRHQRDTKKSFVTCCNECLDEFVRTNYCDEYEIYEYTRCSAYFKCKDIGNLRNMCESVENKTYQSVIPFISSNHCEPAQAGVIFCLFDFRDTGYKRIEEKWGKRLPELWFSFSDLHSLCHIR